MQVNRFKYWKNNKTLLLLAVLALIFIPNLFFAPSPVKPVNKDISTAEQCQSCHQEIYNSYLKTAHYLDSRTASPASIKGSFHKDSNIFSFNQFMEVAMLKEGNKFVQSARFNKEVMQKQAFDIVIGSGRKGQSFLYWKGNQLFQLPISYFTAKNSWTNSPGFPLYPYFERPVPLNCLECHSSAARKITSGDAVNAYDKTSVILSINCERCHGPAKEHVEHHLSHPGETSGKMIVNPARIEDREIRMDVCAVCHSGIRQQKRPPFSFKPGMSLKDYSVGLPVSNAPDTLDVHGNQYGLLASSACYKKSVTMDCSSCHNVHREEINSPALFSSRCMNCHAVEKKNFCSLEMDPAKLSENCIDCHMPVLPSRKIQLNTAASKEIQSDSIRTHFVSIYREQTKKILGRTNLK
jgi:nitrate/TMAO reductase-like tetraheme cytochrome c subunit